MSKGYNEIAISSCFVKMTAAQQKVTFAKSIGFKRELNRRVEAYFKSEKISPRDNVAMYLKTGILTFWVVGSWTFVIFSPAAAWIKLLGCIILGMGIAGFAFSVGHDANHGGYSNNKYVNTILGSTYDLIGLSSYLWKVRHNFLHHTYTNILGHDVEIHGDGLVRMSPTMEHKWIHKNQHIYIWLIYPFIPFYWSLADVHLILIKRRYHDHAIPKPKLWELMILLGGKIFWVGFFIGIPLLVGYTPLETILGFGLTYMTYGFLICVIFMLAHVVETAEFVEPSLGSNYVDDEWAISQVKTTVDFAPKNHFLNWYLGGLNYQVVHHLFPYICHIHYPKIAHIVAEVCEEFGVEYKVYNTLSGAIAANYRWLKIMAATPKIEPNPSTVAVN